MARNDEHGAADENGWQTVEVGNQPADPYAADPEPLPTRWSPLGSYQRGQSTGAGVPPDFWRKFLLGSLIFVGGSYVIILALTILAARYPQLGLNGYVQPPQANVLILSGLTWENLIFLGTVIGLWALVQKLGLVPRPPAASAGAQGGPGQPTGFPAGFHNAVTRYNSSQALHDSFSERDDVNDDRGDDRSSEHGDD